MVLKLAIDGGKPVRDDFLFFHRSSVGRDELNEIADSFASGWLTTGPKTAEFERRFADYLGASAVVGLNSCTAGLHLGLVALGIGEGDEVITTPITFPSTANVIEHQRARTVFVDVEPDTLLIDPKRLEEAITPRTRAAIPVHYAGHPCDMGRIMEIAKEHGIHVIEDCAHAIEAKIGGRHCGTFGEVGAFSFYATKNITCGEGGAACVKSEDLRDKLTVLRLHGLTKDAWKRYDKGGFAHYECVVPGFKYNMMDIQAAMLLHQLDKLEGFARRRREIVAMYDDAFREMPEVQPLARRPGIEHAHHIYPMLLDLERLNCSRDEFLNAMQAENIGVAVHFRALHLHPHYREKYGFRPGDFPNAEHASNRLVSVPLYPSLTDEDVKTVIAAIDKIVAHFRR
ncbi:MAG: UDP-4-amino-4,6-dideoxy-N-acetyl-beta-L-altrosamine transaminase [Candidatus Coatesbacteria bacterium]|nr:MAG: UDP-4-amino-4,6-dideoxy-N-acetyl-beta-L-altrosamine transaminase [Candidatus Coatesbacteria bacterium]